MAVGLPFRSWLKDVRPESCFGTGIEKTGAATDFEQQCRTTQQHALSASSQDSAQLDIDKTLERTLSI